MARADHRETPLWALAKKHGATERVMKALEEAHPRENMTLIALIRCGFWLDAINAVREQGAHSKDTRDRTPLHVCAMHPDAPVGLIVAVKESWPQAANQRDKAGWLPLHHSAHHGGPADLRGGRAVGDEILRSTSSLHGERGRTRRPRVDCGIDVSRQYQLRRRRRVDVVAEEEARRAAEVHGAKAEAETRIWGSSKTTNVFCVTWMRRRRGGAAQVILRPSAGDNRRALLATASNRRRRRTFPMEKQRRLRRRRRSPPTNSQTALPLPTWDSRSAAGFCICLSG